MTSYTYTITTGPEHHSATDRPWMLLKSTTLHECTSVGERCHFTARTTDQDALESALEEDSDVIEFNVLLTADTNTANRMEPDAIRCPSTLRRCLQRVGK